MGTGKREDGWGGVPMGREKRAATEGERKQGEVEGQPLPSVLICLSSGRTLSLCISVCYQRPRLFLEPMSWGPLAQHLGCLQRLKAAVGVCILVGGM